MNKALLVLFCSCFVLSGEATVSDSLTLREVEVIGGERSYMDGRLTNTVSEVDIVSLPATTLADVLQTLPSLDIRARGANGAQTDISLRGGTFDQVSVLLNGVCVNDAQTGHYAMNIPVPLSSIARIDVLQDAINIITVRPDSDTYYSSMSLGMNMFAKVDAHGAWHQADWRITTAIDYTHNSGYYAPRPSEKEQTALNNSDFNGVNIYTSASYKGLLMQVGAQYKNAGAGSFYGFGSQDQFDATRTAFTRGWVRHGRSLSVSGRGSSMMQKALCVTMNQSVSWMVRFSINTVTGALPSSARTSRTVTTTTTAVFSSPERGQE